MYYKLYLDKTGEGWTLRATCLSEATAIRLRDWAMGQGWAVKLEPA